MAAYASTYRLSEGERRALAYSYQGCSSHKEIAAALGVHESTIATYWRRIEDKTGVRGVKSIHQHLLEHVIGVPWGGQATASPRSLTPQPASRRRARSG